MKPTNRYELTDLGRRLDLAFAKVVIRSFPEFGKAVADPNPMPRLRLWRWWP